MSFKMYSIKKYRIFYIKQKKKEKNFTNRLTKSMTKIKLEVNY